MIPVENIPLLPCRGTRNGLEVPAHPILVVQGGNILAVRGCIHAVSSDRGVVCDGESPTQELHGLPICLQTRTALTSLGKKVRENDDDDVFEGSEIVDAASERRE